MMEVERHNMVHDEKLSSIPNYFGYLHTLTAQLLVFLTLCQFKPDSCLWPSRYIAKRESSEVGAREAR